MISEFRYRAFISYSHSDEVWAKWLHKSLETYRVPKHLVGTETEFGPVPERFAPVFRDREELATATSLGDTLVRALEQSAFQIVICSPAAAKSRWVNEEILTFKRMGREHRIFCLLVAGEPGASPELECFPDALIYKLGSDGQLTAERSEPIAADARPHKDRKQDVLLKLLAGMLGIGLDELKRREARRRQRRLMALVSASVAGMVITSTLAAAAWLARNEAERQREHATAEAETARQTTRFMVDLFKVSDPSEALGNSITAREILDRGAARIEKDLVDQPGIQATLMDTMGTVYTSLGLYKAAIPLARKALSKRQSLPGDGGDAVAQSLQHLGEVLTLNSDYKEAERCLREALTIRRQQLGNDHPDVAATLTALADVMSYTGEYAEGEPMIQEALRIRRSAYGELHPDVAASIGDLGVNYGQRGDFKQAEVYLRQALALQRQLHPTVHPELAEAMNNLGWALMSLNEPVLAEPLFRGALDMKRKMLGEAHPELAAGLMNLAMALQSHRDYKGAEKAYREALAMNRKLLGDSHPQIAANLNNLAFVLYAEGDHAAAIAQLRESLDMQRRELGAGHPDVANGAALLAFWLIDINQYQEAARLVDESLAIGLKAFGAKDPQYASTLIVKANLLLATRRFAEAKQVAVEARRILALTLPESDWQVAMAKNAEGAALAGLHDYAAAEPLLLGSLDGLRDSPLPDLVRSGRDRLANLYTAWGRPELASPYRE
jgi:Flp pilus assembly protein TadD